MAGPAPQKATYFHPPEPTVFPDPPSPTKRGMIRQALELLFREEGAPPALKIADFPDKEGARGGCYYTRDYARELGYEIDYAYVDMDNGRVAVVIRRGKKEEEEAA